MEGSGSLGGKVEDVGVFAEAKLVPGLDLGLVLGGLRQVGEEGCGQPGGRGRGRGGCHLIGNEEFRNGVVWR